MLDRKFIHTIWHPVATKFIIKVEVNRSLTVAAHNFFQV